MIYIIHGTKASSKAHWFPWLKQTLRDQHIESQIPDMPTPEGQNFASWQRTFHDQYGELKADDILIGHSIGTAFILRYLQEQSVKIKSAILICPFVDKIGNPEYDTLNRTFVEKQLDWIKIKSRAEKFICLAGDDDPYVSLPLSQKVATHLGCELQIIKNGGHLNTESGYTTFPLLLDMLPISAIDRQSA
jgi:predicted alpha/beta hydrolase family esterase